MRPLAILAPLLLLGSAQEAVLPPLWRPPARPALPVVRNAAWVRVPLDAFVLHGLERAGLDPAPEASPERLFRRLHLDLCGLPPKLEDLDAFLKDDASDALERAVDRLLASPAYGERRAQFWLDLVRYADTNGFHSDRPTNLWRYRDWVVRAFNEDLAFDRFTELQIAGDLVVDGGDDARIAAGYHRCAPLSDEGGSDLQESRWRAKVDRLNTTATAWMGLTLSCALCHDHKYDPLAQKDYAGLLAFFERSADVEVVRPGFSVPHVLETAGQGPPRSRLREQGLYDRPKEEVAAAVPGSLHPWPEGAPPDRRGLARWLTSPRNPLTARVLANQLWIQCFGRPLVETPEDFGSQGAKPSHPELLDHLALDLVEGGWRLKPFLRRLVLSAAYRQDSRRDPAHRQRDPDNRLYSRGGRWRLDAEAVRDAALSAAGLLSPKLGGPPIFPPLPETSGKVLQNDPAYRWELSAGAERYRRGLYVFRSRTAPYPMFAAFDAPSREVCTVRRPRTLTPFQALHGLNDPVMREAAEALGRAMEFAAVLEGEDAALRVGFRRCTSRAPGPAELDLLRGALRKEPERPWERVASALLNLEETLSRE
jgi:hypothetical protein